MIELEEAIKNLAANGHYSCSTCDRYESKDMIPPKHGCFIVDMNRFLVAYRSRKAQVDGE